MKIQAKVIKIDTLSLPNPQYGDMKLNVFPFVHNGKYSKLPEQFKLWEYSFNAVLKHIPLHDGANDHFVTIDSKFFTTDDFLRREGVHIDGNFCVDPNFNHSTWGGDKDGDGTWAGLHMNENMEIVSDWASPYDIDIPIGTYVSDNKGGIISISNEIGCQAWEGEFIGEVSDGGDFSNMYKQLSEDKKIVFGKDEVYFMTSNTPHETLMIPKGTRRTFMRISLNHEYPNEILPCLKLDELLKNQ